MRPTTFTYTLHHSLSYASCFVLVFGWIAKQDYVQVISRIELTMSSSTNESEAGGNTSALACAIEPEQVPE